MNELTNHPAPVTMTSLELVDYINSQRAEGDAEVRHRDFCVKVPKVLGEGVCEKFRTPYLNPQNGQTYTIYRFPKREACLMAMSYSYELQAKVFDRMTALEAQTAQPQPQQPAIPQTLPEALRLAADLAEHNNRLAQENRAQSQALAQAAPKAAAFELVSADTHCLTFTQAAKVLGVKRDTLTRLLAQDHWIYRQNGSWVAYQQQIQAGRLLYKEAKYTDADTGMQTYRPYCHITPKGIAALAQMLSTRLALRQAA